MRIFASLFLVGALAACGGGSDLKAAGQECYATSECETGLTCDFGQSPAVCSQSQTTLPDAAPTPTVDADLTVPDADPSAPDAQPTPDASPVVPDAAVPDAAVPDAAVPDAALPDAA